MYMIKCHEIMHKDMETKQNINKLSQSREAK